MSCVVSSATIPAALRTKRPPPPITKLFSRGTSIQPPGFTGVVTGTTSGGPNCCGIVAVAPGLLTQ